MTGSTVVGGVGAITGVIVVVDTTVVGVAAIGSADFVTWNRDGFAAATGGAVVPGSE